MRITDGLGDGSPTYLDPTLDHPLYMEAVEQALALCEEDAGPAHLKLVLEWDLQGKERYLSTSEIQAIVAYLNLCFHAFTYKDVCSHVQSNTFVDVLYVI
jgi:hypothetical protein